MPQAIRTYAEWGRDKHRQERDLQKRLLYAGIPEYMRHLGWEHYEDSARTPEGESVKDILLDYADNWSPQEREGVVLLGKPGVGKTHGLITLGIDLSCRNAMVRFMTYSDLVELKKEVIKAERVGEETGDWGDYDRKALNVWLTEEECDVLMLDDVGKEYRAASGWSDSGLDRLLRRRQAAGKVTCIASNLTMEDWQNYNESMASFLYGVGEVVVCVGPDRRRRRPGAARRRAVTRAGR